MIKDNNMREIIFRGKGDTRYNDGEWCFGVPIKDSEGDWQICTHNCKRVVIPETITECTGAYDITGQLIFEGDQVNMFGQNDSTGKTGVIVYDSDECAFHIELCNTYVPLISAISSQIKVVGNIFDNP